MLGVTISYPRSLDVMKAVGDHFKEQLVSAVKDGKRLRLIGDNLNFMQGVAYENMDRHSHMVHMFASCALLSEKVFTDRPDIPEVPLNDITMKEITFSRTEYRAMRDDLVPLVAKVLSKYLPQLKHFMDTAPKQFAAPQPEFCEKTQVVPLPVLQLNEQYDKDTVKILEYYQGLVKELPLQTAEPIHIGGDQLTRERFGTALRLRIGNTKERSSANLGPATFEFFHLGMNYLNKMVFDTLWNKQGEEELGTLRGERERINRKSVDPDVAKAYEADKLFFLNYTSAHIVESALDFFGMDSRNDYPTKNQPPQDASPEQRKAWVYQAVGDMLDEYCFRHWSGHDTQVSLPGKFKFLY